MDEKEPEFEKHIKEMEYRGRNQYIPGAFVNSNSWPKFINYKIGFWSLVVIIVILSLTLFAQNEVIKDLESFGSSVTSQI